MIKSIIKFGLSEGIARVLNWLLLIILPFILPISEYGKVSIILVIIYLSNGLFLIGQDKAVLRFLGDYKKKEFLFTLLLTWLIVATTFIIFFFIIYIVLIKINIELPNYIIFIIICLIVLLLCFNKIYLGVLRVAGDSKNYAIVNITFYLIQFILIISLSLYYKNYLGYLYGLLISLVIIFFIELKSIIPKIEKKFDKHLSFELLRFGWPLLLQVTGAGILMYIDRLMIGFYMGSKPVGLYTLAYAVGSSITFVHTVLSVHLEPYIYSKFDRIKESERLLNFYSSLEIVIMAIASGFIILFINYIIKQFYGDNYLFSITIIPIILAAHIFNPLFFQGYMRLIICKSTKLIAVSTLLTSLMNIILNFLLINKMGIIGAAIATFISYFFQSIFILLASYRVRNINIKQIWNKPFISINILLILFLALNINTATNIFIIILLLVNNIYSIYLNNNKLSFTKIFISN